jgi:LysM repeat protein
MMVNPGTTTILHTVQPKETLYAISKKYDVKENDVLKWNDMENADLRIGQQLRINKKTADGTN